MVDRESGTTRRKWFTAAGSVLVLGLAGCSSDTGGSEGEPEDDSGDDGQSPSTEQQTLSEREYDTPGKAAADFVRAMYLPDITSANELIHTDSPVGEVGLSDIEFADPEDGEIETNVEIQDTTILEETETATRVEVDRAILYDGEVTVSGSISLDVREEGDQWRVVLDENDLPI